MPKGFNSKGYKAGGGIMTISCLECGKRFRGNQSKVNKSMLLHTKYNHPEHLQERSNEVKTRIKTKDYDTNMLIGKYGTDEHNKSEKHLFFKSMLEYHTIEVQIEGVVEVHKVYPSFPKGLGNHFLEVGL